MKKTIILFLAVLLSVGAYAADSNVKIGSDSQALTKKEQHRTLRGYKGFVELGMGATFHNYGIAAERKGKQRTTTAFGIEAVTSHGYQFNNSLYLGFGVGINECTETNVMVPMFADFRINILNKRISPLLYFRGGYAAGNYYGGYAGLGVGVRAGLKHRLKSAVYAAMELTGLIDGENSFLAPVFGRGSVGENESRSCTRLLCKIGYEF